MDMQEMFKEPFWYWRRCNRGDKMKERITSTKERPMLFSTEMVKAILDLKKTQTRRVITKNNSVIGERGDWNKLCWDGSDIHDTQFDGRKTAPLPFVDGHANEYQPYEQQYLHVPYNWKEDETIYRVYPRWQVGDRLWVRETFNIYHLFYDGYNGGYEAEEAYSSIPKQKPLESHCLCYKAESDNNDEEEKWRPSIFMPRWASRKDLEITGLRAELFHDISLVDAIAEGFNSIEEFKAEYIRINHHRLKDVDLSKLWNWVIEFKVVKA